VRKAGVIRNKKNIGEDKVYLCIEVDENGIEQSTNTLNKYYKSLLIKKGDQVVFGCAQEVKKDEDYYYVEIYVPLNFSQLIAMPSVIGKKMKIKFKYVSTYNQTPIEEDKIVECEIYE